MELEERRRIWRENYTKNKEKYRQNRKANEEYKKRPRLGVKGIIKKYGTFTKKPVVPQKLPKSELVPYVVNYYLVKEAHSTGTLNRQPAEKFERIINKVLHGEAILSATE